MQSNDQVEPAQPDGMIEEPDQVEPQFRSPSLGDQIQVFSRDLDDWRDAKVIKTDKRVLKQYPHFYNVEYSDSGEQGSVKLDSEFLWRFLDPNRQEYFWWKWGHLYSTVARAVGEEG